MQVEALPTIEKLTEALSLNITAESHFRGVFERQHPPLALRRSLPGRVQVWLHYLAAMNPGVVEQAIRFFDHRSGPHRLWK